MRSNKPFQGVIVITIAIVFILAIAVIPNRYVPSFYCSAAEKTLNMRNEYRRTIIQAAGALGVAIGAYFTWRRLGLTEDQVAALRDQIQIQREGQTDERFARAIDQLGADASSIRQGGIYSLGHLAATTRYCEPVVMTLAAFIREKSPAPMSEKSDDDQVAELPQDQGPAAMEVQAAIRVVALHQQRLDFAPGNRLFLPSVNIATSDVSNGNLERAAIVYSNLCHVKCTKASFRHASIENCLLRSVRGSDADFVEATLDFSDFANAELVNSDFSRARAQFTNFEGARLDGAKFDQADLSWADFSNADLQHSSFNGVEYGGEAKRHPEFFGADLRGADLSGFEFLDPKRLVDADYDEMTSWPDGFCPRSIDPTRPGHLPGD